MDYNYNLNCQRCGSDRVFSVSSHASDLHTWDYKDKDGEGYLPFITNMGGGDDLEVDVCLNCGQTQGKWPVSDPDFEDVSDPDFEDE